MRRRLSLASMAVGLCVAVFASAAYAQGKAKPPSPPPVAVTSLVHDADDTSVFLLAGDGFGSYDSSGEVVSQIYSTSGDWELDLRGQTARAVHLSFITTNGSASAVPTGLYNARLISRCFDADGAITGLLAIAEGSSNTRCALRVILSAGGNSYFLVMSPLYQGTSWVTVSCATDSDEDTTCERWTIVPGTTAGLPVAALYRLNRGKEVFAGSYYLTFSIEVTKP